MGRIKLVKKYAKSLDPNQGKLGEAGTDYRSKFVYYDGFKPVQSVKPPPTPPRPQFPPMQTKTTTMAVFTPKDASKRREPIIPDDKRDPAEGQVSNVTVYRNDFEPKEGAPPAPLRPPSNADRVPPKAIKFDGRTLNKDFYKEWKAKRRQKYGELPSFTMPMIYPDKAKLAGNQEVFKSRTATDYPYKTIPKPEQAQVAPPNIKVGEGKHSMETTNQSTFQFDPQALSPTQMVKPKSRTKNYAKPKIDFKTRYHADFPTREQYPLPPKPCTPAPDTLEIKMNNMGTFDTEQRKQFLGYDVKKHKRPELSKLEDNTQIPTDKMATNTTSMRDFSPKELAVIRITKDERAPKRDNEPKAKFQDMTMNKTHFKDWGVARRPRFGDFHEGYKEIILVPKLKAAHDFSTTTRSVFVEKKAAPVQPFIPAQNTIDTSQPHHFVTTSGSCFKQPPSSAYDIEEVEVKC